jgi:sterol desaturase/sphingolipid hydroxylase (fatty acid hydroxylase superfamily)
LAHFVFLRGLPLLQRFGSPMDYKKRLPGLWKMYWDITICSNIQILMFAVVHRAFHHGPLYRAFHRKHHEYVGPISIAAENAHVVEAIFANFLPVLAGPLLRGIHPFVLVAYLLWRLEETYEGHSGFCFYGSFLHQLGFTNAEQTAYHDAHHLLNRGNFSIELFDHLMGTQDKWLALGRTKGYVEWSERLKEIRRKREQAEKA